MMGNINSWGFENTSMLFGLLLLHIYVSIFASLIFAR